MHGREGNKRRSSQAEIRAGKTHLTLAGRTLSLSCSRYARLPISLALLEKPIKPVKPISVAD